MSSLSIDQKQQQWQKIFTEIIISLFIEFKDDLQSPSNIWKKKFSNMAYQKLESAFLSQRKSNLCLQSAIYSLKIELKTFRSTVQSIQVSSPPEVKPFILTNQLWALSWGQKSLTRYLSNRDKFQGPQAIELEQTVPIGSYSVRTPKDTILIVGGHLFQNGKYEIQNTIWEFSDKISLFARLINRRTYASCCVLGSSVYVVGGGANDQSLASCQKISLDSNVHFKEKVSQIAPLKRAVNLPCICTLSNQSILKVGGSRDHQMELYSIQENNWRSLNLDGGSLQLYSDFHWAMMVKTPENQNEVLVVGGQNHERRRLRLRILQAENKVIIVHESQGKEARHYGAFAFSPPLVRGIKAYAINQNSQLIIWDLVDDY